MALNGWIKVHRQLLEHWVSQEPELFAFWMRLLLEANHSDKKRMFNGALVEIRRGQTLFGLDAFESKSGISKKRLRRYLDMLEKEGMIGRQKTNKYSLISILNYDDYQLEGSQEAGKGQAEGKPRASQGQHRKNVKNGENVEKTDMKCGASAEASEPAVVLLPTNKNNTEGEEYPVTQSQIDEWQEVYPAVNCLAETKQAKLWLKANPAKRKTYGGMAKFLNSWMARQQNKGGNAVPGQQASRVRRDFPFGS